MVQQPASMIIDESGHLLDQLRDILVHVAEGGVLGRQHAVAYLGLRSELLESDLGKLLPGFMYQCVTVMRFKEFISLYDPDAMLRVAFIDTMINRCRHLRSSTELIKIYVPTPEPDPWKF